MPLISLGTDYYVFFQDVAETHPPIQMLISGGFNDELIVLFANQIKDAPFFQLYLDSPEPPAPMKVVQITQLAVDRDVPLI